MQKKTSLHSCVFTKYTCLQHVTLLSKHSLITLSAVYFIMIFSAFLNLFYFLSSLFLPDNEKVNNIKHMLDISAFMAILHQQILHSLVYN